MSEETYTYTTKSLIDFKHAVFAKDKVVKFETALKNITSLLDDRKLTEYYQMKRAILEEIDRAMK